MKKDDLGAAIIYSFQGEQIKFVLIQDRFDKWTFPKGKKISREDFETTTLREASEETGLENLEIESFLDKITYTVDHKKKVVYFYLVKSLDSDNNLVPDIQEGIKKAVWKNPIDVKRFLDYNNFVPCFEKALEYLKISF